MKWKQAFQDNKALKTYGGVLAALLALVILFSFLSPHFLKTNNIFTVLSQVSIIAIMAFGMTFVLMIGEIDLSVGSIAALSGLVLGLSLTWGLSGPLAILVTLIVGALAGLANGLISARLRIPTFIVTVATMGIFRGIGYATTDAKPVGVDDSFILLLGNKKLFDIIPVPVIIVAVLLVFSHILLSKTKFGRRAKMVGEIRRPQNMWELIRNHFKLRFLSYRELLLPFQVFS